MLWDAPEIQVLRLGQGEKHGAVFFFLKTKKHEPGMTCLRTASFPAALSSMMPLADTGAVLSMLDWPAGCDLAVQAVCAGFRLIRR